MDIIWIKSTEWNTFIFCKFISNATHWLFKCIYILYFHVFGPKRLPFCFTNVQLPHPSWKQSFYVLGWILYLMLHRVFKIKSQCRKVCDEFTLLCFMDFSVELNSEGCSVVLLLALWPFCSPCLCMIHSFVGVPRLSPGENVSNCEWPVQGVPSLYPTVAG